MGETFLVFMVMVGGAVICGVIDVLLGITFKSISLTRQVIHKLIYLMWGGVTYWVAIL